MLGQFIYTLHPLVLAFLVVGGTVSVSFLCIVCCRHFIRLAYEEATEFKIETYSDAFGVAFAIFLGLIIVTAWSSYDQTDNILRDETNYLNDLFKLSKYVGDPEKDELRNTLKQYVTAVITEEWPLLPQGENSQKVGQHLFHVLDILYSHESSNKTEEIVRSELNKITTHLLEKRRSRNINAESSVTPIMWMILISCNVIAFFILGLAVQGSLIFHVLLQSLYAFGIGLMILLVIILDRPFYFGMYYGGGITYEHFETLLDEWNGEEKQVSSL